MSLRVGLVGAGPWASGLHGPGIVASRHTTLTGVWARRPEAAAAVAKELDTVAYDSPDALFDAVDAVSFALPPEPQAELAARAAAAGCHLLLDKPIALDVDAGQRLANAVDTAGVKSAVFFTSRYTERARAFLDDAHQGNWYAARAAWVSGALLVGEYVDSPWRHERGPLWDVGPHAVELLDAALGPVTEVKGAARGPRGLTQLLLGHVGGQVSQVTLGMHVPLEVPLDEIELFGESGQMSFSLRGVSAADAYQRMLAELAGQIGDGGDGPPCDVHRGLAILRILAEAEDLIGTD